MVPSSQSDAALGRGVVVLVEVAGGPPGALLGECAEHLEVFQLRILQPVLYGELQ